MQSYTPIRKIVLIDDDGDDCFLFKTVVNEIDPAIRVSVYFECDEALANLDRVLPDLIFLDINMPRVDGLRCIRLLMEAGKVKNIPVVMYSSSGSPRDINASYGLGAALYFQKEGGLDTMTAALRRMLSLNWQEPANITWQHFRNGSYVPFGSSDVADNKENIG